MKYFKENIRAIEPYKPVALSSLNRLDANESPYNIANQFTEDDIRSLLSINFNHYPDGSSNELKTAISKYSDVSEECILCGNGSDELIKIIFDSTIAPGDKILIHTPTFSQYSLNAQISNASVIEVSSKKDMSVDIDQIIKIACAEKPKLIFLCTPNNPTGSLIPLSDIEKTLENTDAFVVVDEAYFEFCGLSIADKIQKYPNLIVLRTLSKAFGLAGLRIGYLISSTTNIDFLNRVRMPYNINSFSSKLAVLALSREASIHQIVLEIIKERDRMETILNSLSGIKLYKSNGNFLFFYSDYADQIQSKLIQKNIGIRKFSSEILRNTLRITIGKSEINEIVINTIKEVLSNVQTS
ncbi:MAG: histidinol-phosphate transaminase [Alkaliphilus sp.]|nr:histidinol-phosphate transaminase [bacterium AH-315-L21]PHS34855.1 MAG: histidinol-phosphate transaminase [Alkaliphilus sp.]